MTFRSNDPYADFDREDAEIAREEKTSRAILYSFFVRISR